MALSRFKDARADYDGPVSGALQIVCLNIDVATGATGNFKVDLPPGMRFRVTDVTMRASAVNGSPTVILGLTTNGSSRLVASTAVTTNLGALTVKTASQQTARDAVIVAQVAGSVVGGVLSIVGHVSAPPDTVLVRTGNRSHF